MSLLYDAPGPKAIQRHRVIAMATVVFLLAVAALVVWKLWTEDQFTAEKWEPFVTPSVLEYLAEGLVGTLKTALFAILGALAVGVVFGVAKLSDHKFISVPAWLFVEFFRAVPLLTLTIFIWFLLYQTQVGNIWPLVIALVLYNGSVLAEVFRAGINAVPAGQVEAAYALGLRKGAVTRIIQLPQAIKIMTPAIISQCIVALKDTSLAFYIVAPSLTYSGRGVWNQFDNRLATAIVLAVIYIILNLLLEQLGKYVQRRLTTSPTVKAVEIKI